MNTSNLTPTNKGLDLIRQWISAQERKQRAWSEHNSASCEVSNATSELVKWIVPKNAKLGDVFCIPVLSTFLQVRMIEKKSHSAGKDEETGREIITLEPVVGWREGLPPLEKV